MSAQDRTSVHWTRRVFGPLSVVVAAIAVMLLSRVGFIERAEHWTADWRTALFSERKSEQHKSVALVLISEETLEPLPVRVPLDRAMVGRVLRAITSARPIAIGMDIVFTRPTHPSADADLIAAIREADVPLVLGVIDERAGLPAKQLAYHRKFIAEANRLTGHVFFERKTNKFGISERVIRQMAEPHGVATRPFAFAEQLARIKVRDARPYNTRIAWLLPPHDGSDTFYEVDANELLGAAEDAAPLLAGLTGRIVLIGVDLVDADQHLTPMTVVSEQRVAGVRIHAQIVAQLIDGRWLREPHRHEELLLLVLIGLAGVTASQRYGLGKHKKALAWGGSAALVLAGLLAFKFGGLILPYTTALAMWIAAIGLGDRIDPLYHRAARILNVISARGGLRWDTLYRLGSVFGGRYWRGRL